MHYFTIPLIAFVTVLNTIIPGNPIPETFTPTQLPDTFSVDVANLVIEYCPSVPNGLVTDALQLQSPVDMILYTAPVGLYAWQSAPLTVHEWGHTLVDYAAHRASYLTASATAMWGGEPRVPASSLCARGRLSKSNSTTWCHGVSPTSVTHRPQLARAMLLPPTVLTLPASPVFLTLPAPPRWLTLPAAPPRPPIVRAPVCPNITFPPPPAARPVRRPVPVLVFPPLKPLLELTISSYSPHPAVFDTSVVVTLRSTLTVPADRLNMSARGAHAALEQFILDNTMWFVMGACAIELMWGLYLVTQFLLTKPCVHSSVDPVGAVYAVRRVYTRVVDELSELEEASDVFDGLECYTIDNSNAGQLRGLAPDLFSLYDRREPRTKEPTGSTLVTLEVTGEAAQSELVVSEIAQQPSSVECNEPEQLVDPLDGLDLDPVVPRRGILGGLAPDLFKLCKRLGFFTHDAEHSTKVTITDEDTAGELVEPEDALDPFAGLECDAFGDLKTNYLGGLAPDLFRFHKQLDQATILLAEPIGTDATMAEETGEPAQSELVVPEVVEQPSANVVCGGPEHVDEPFTELGLDLFNTPRAGLLGGLAPDLFRFFPGPSPLESAPESNSEELAEPNGSTDATSIESEPEPESVTVAQPAVIETSLLPCNIVTPEDTTAAPEPIPTDTEPEPEQVAVAKPTVIETTPLSCDVATSEETTASPEPASTDTLETPHSTDAVFDDTPNFGFLDAALEKDSPEQPVTMPEETGQATQSELAVSENAEQPSANVVCDGSEQDNEPFAELDLEFSDKPGARILAGLAPDLFRFFFPSPSPLELAPESNSEESVVPSGSDNAAPIESESESELEPHVVAQPTAIEATPSCDIPILEETIVLPEPIPVSIEPEPAFVVQSATLGTTLPSCDVGTPEEIVAIPELGPVSIDILETSHSTDAVSDETPNLGSLDAVLEQDSSKQPVDTPTSPSSPTGNKLSSGSIVDSRNSPVRGSLASAWAQAQYRPGAIDWSDEAEELSARPLAPVPPPIVSPKVSPPRTTGAARLFATALGASGRRTGGSSVRVASQPDISGPVSEKREPDVQARGDWTGASVAGGSTSASRWAVVVESGQVSGAGAGQTSGKDGAGAGAGAGEGAENGGGSRRKQYRNKQEHFFELRQRRKEEKKRQKLEA